MGKDQHIYCLLSRTAGLGTRLPRTHPSAHPSPRQTQSHLTVTFPQIPNMQIPYPRCWESSMLVYLFISENKKHLDKVVPAITCRVRL